MKYGWVIYSRDTLSSKFGDNAFDWMIESALNYDLKVEILFEEDFNLMTSSGELTFYYKGTLLAKPDFVLMRSYALDLAKHLEEANIPVFNSSLSMKESQDKWQTHQILAGHKLRSPNALFSSHKLSFAEVEKMLGSPFVIKGLLGSKGEDVHLVSCETTLERAFDQLKDQRYMYQKFIKESSGTDIRVHVIGGEIVAAVRRRSEGDFKSNFHQGGSAESVELTEEMKKISVESAKALKLDFAGIDLLESSEGPTVCEVNAIPGFRTICLTSETDIPSLIFKHIKFELT